MYQKIIHYLLFTFAFFLPLQERISTFIVVTTVLTVIIGLLLKKTVFSNRSNKTLIILPLLFLIYLISFVFFSENTDFKFIERKLSLLVFPFIFYSKLNVNKIKVLRFFVFGCALAYFICLGNSIVNSFFLENGIYSFNPLLSDSRTFFEAIIFEGNYFFGKYFSVLYHTSYFAIYQSFAFLIVLTYKRNFSKLLFWIFIFIFPLGIIQTMSMAGFASLVMVLLIFTYVKIRSKKLKLVVFCSVLLIVLCGLLFHPRLKNLVNDVTNKELILNPKALDGVMLRFLSWNASIEIIFENPITGVGVGDAQYALNTEYKNKGYVQPLSRKLNAHNQYLQLYVESGLFGVLIIFYLIILLLRKAKQEKYQNKIVITSFAALIVFNFMFESFLNRYIGISFFSFFFCLLTYSMKDRNNFENV